MFKAIINTSPLLYLHRIGGIEWLPRLFDEVWTPEAVKNELQAGRRKGYDVPNPDDYSWLKVVNPKSTPSEWLVLDLGVGEIAAMALAADSGFAAPVYAPRASKVVFRQGCLARHAAAAKTNR